jgi:hypothetical protein
MAFEGQGLDISDAEGSSSCPYLAKHAGRQVHANQEACPSRLFQPPQIGTGAAAHIEDCSEIGREM